MNITPEQIKDEYLRRVNIDFENVTKKIADCFNYYKSENKSENYRIYEQVVNCSFNESDNFREKWFSTAPKEIEGTKEAYDCYKETYNLYCQIISMPQKLIENE